MLLTRFRGNIVIERGGKVKANFIRKPTHDELIPNDEFIIEKEVILEKDKFYNFINHPLNDFTFISDNIDLMYTKDGVYHCIYITAHEVDYGILVQSEGSSYARYAAFLKKGK